jgi:nicotinamide-nucleotide amidase
MRIYILSIGNELLMGDTINTNASWLGDFFHQRGVDISECLTIEDSKEAIVDGLNRALSKAELIIITGGLGPTHDDITKKTLAKFFNVGMKRDPAVLAHVEGLFSKRGIEMQAINIMQSDIPENASVLFNDLGTAPGMWFQINDKQAVVSLPGVPYEMKFLTQERVWPKLTEVFGLQSGIRTSYFRTAGIGESSLSEQRLPELMHLLEQNQDVSVAYLPSAGEVKLRVTTVSEDLKQAALKAAPIEDYIKSQVEDLIYSYERNEDLPEAIGKVLTQHGLTMATAESCTGGAIANAITDVAGSSAYFLGSVVAYQNEVKSRVLGVNDSDIEKFGAVSKEVALQMAKGIAKLTGADIGISTTGVAGPGGGSEEKPVGTIWIGFWTKDTHFALKAFLSKDRLVNKVRATKLAIEAARRVILGKEVMPFELKKQF